MAMLMTLFAGFVSLAEENTPTRVINVVYDDSGSMVETGGQKANVAKVHEMLTKAGNTRLMRSGKHIPTCRRHRQTKNGLSC